MKFGPINQSYDDPTGYWWVGHPDVGALPGSLEELLIQNRAKLDFVEGVSDPDPCYDYREYAIVRLGRRYFLCETSGCSCPSPTETWEVLEEATTLKKLKKQFLSGDYYRSEWATAWASQS